MSYGNEGRRPTLCLLKSVYLPSSLIMKPSNSSGYGILSDVSITRVINLYFLAE